MVPLWYLLDGFPLPKGTEATPEDRLPHHVAECHTSTLLSTHPNTATNSLGTIMASKTTSTTRVVSTIAVINQVMASRIIVEAEEVTVEAAAVVGRTETNTPTTKAEGGIIGTRKQMRVQLSDYFSCFFQYAIGIC